MPLPRLLHRPPTSSTAWLDSTRGIRVLSPASGEKEGDAAAAPVFALDARHLHRGAEPQRGRRQQCQGEEAGAGGAVAEPALQAGLLEDGASRGAGAGKGRRWRRRGRRRWRRRPLDFLAYFLGGRTAGKARRTSKRLHRYWASERRADMAGWGPFFSCKYRSVPPGCASRSRRSCACGAGACYWW